MRIVALTPELAELVHYFGLHESLVGVSHRVSAPEELKNVTVLTQPSGRFSAQSLGNSQELLRNLLSPDLVDLKSLAAVAPDIILTSDRTEEFGVGLKVLREALHQFMPSKPKLFSFNPTLLEDIYQQFVVVAQVINVPEKGMGLAGQAKAQFMDWARNFYDRMRGKKVTFISSIEPLQLAGNWVPDMVHLNAASCQNFNAGKPALSTSWPEIVKFAPHVIIVAVEGKSVEENVKLLSTLEKIPDWEMIPAVKRSEVVFADGKNMFYRATPNIVDSMAILVSALAGLESGYISKRDSFYRLRWVELNRHKFK